MASLKMTTIGDKIEPELGKLGWPVEVLDGDEIHQNLSKGLGLSREDLSSVRKVGNLIFVSLVNILWSRQFVCKTCIVTGISVRIIGWNTGGQFEYSCVLWRICGIRVRSQHKVGTEQRILLKREYDGRSQ